MNTKGAIVIMGMLVFSGMSDGADYAASYEDAIRIGQSKNLDMSALKSPDKFNGDMQEATSRSDCICGDYPSYEEYLQDFLMTAEVNIFSSMLNIDQFKVLSSKSCKRFSTYEEYLYKYAQNVAQNEGLALSGLRNYESFMSAKKRSIENFIPMVDKAKTYGDHIELVLFHGRAEKQIEKIVFS